MIKTLKITEKDKKKLEVQLKEDYPKDKKNDAQNNELLQ